jgi:hypothetical protein
MCPQEQTHFTLWPIGRQRLEVSFDQGPLVSDAGLRGARALDRSLGALTDRAARLPDPRSPTFARHATERILTQQVYQVLAGYPDGNDADPLRQGPLFQALAGTAPAPEGPLASASTPTRFAYAHTRRGQREGAPEGLLVRRAAPCERLEAVNAFPVELFMRPRASPPAEVILGAGATDDPVHGQQALSGYHGYYRQHPYLPLLAFDGASGFPLACGLRPGTAHASLGAAEGLRGVVRALGAAWPGVVITLRGDNGRAVPAAYDSCAQEDVRYALGLASNAVLERAVACASADLEEYYRAYGRRDPFVQRFQESKAYQAGSGPPARRVVAQVERTPQGSQRRFVVTDRPGKPDEVYKGFYVRRGAVPEQPIGALKNGLRADRLSACGLCANAWRRLLHGVACALVVPFRAANAGVPEVACAAVGTLRQRRWKVPAVGAAGARRVVRRLSTAWPWRGVFGRVLEAVTAFAARRAGAGAAPMAAPGLPS